MDAPGALSPALDTTGTSGNDLYKGVIGATTTLQDTDDIDGNGGTDELSVLVTTATTAVDDAIVDTNPTTYTPLFLTEVEKVTVRDTTAAVAGTGANSGVFDTSLVTVNLQNATGVKEVVNNSSAETVTFQNIGTAAVTTQNITTAGVGTTFTRGQSSVTDALTINLNTVGKAVAPGSAAVAAGAINSDHDSNDATAVTINTTGYVSVASANVTGTVAGAATHTAETVTINAAGKTDFGIGITGFNTAKAGKIVVTGEGSVDLDTLAGAVSVVDASANTGGITLDGTTYGGTAAGTDAGLKITGGSGKDSISVAGDATAVVNTGAGDDTVTLTTTHTKGAQIAGGEGTDRIVLTSAMANALDAQTTAGTDLRATLTGFEQLGIADTLAADFNINQAGGYNYLAVNDVNNGGAAVTVSGFTTGGTVEFKLAGNQTAALEIGLTDAATSSTDEINLKLNADLIDNANHTVRAGVTGINVVNVDANDARDNVQDNNLAAGAQDNEAEDGYTLFLTNAANVNTLNITGTSAVNYTLRTGTDAVKLIDASTSTGNVTIDVSNFAGTERVEIKGSQGTNTIVGDNAAFGEKITGGAKADSITGGAGADDMTGNGGRDAFVFAAMTDSGLTGSTVDQISDFGLSTAAVTAAQSLAMSTVVNFQAAAFAKGGDNADILDLVNDPEGDGDTDGIAVASDFSAFTNGVLTALEGVDTSSTEFTGKDIKLNIVDGILSISGADAGMVDTLAEFVAVADLAAETEGETLAFELSGNTYVFQQGTTADDMLVELTGVTGAGSVALAGANVAADAGAIFII